VAVIKVPHRSCYLATNDEFRYSTVENAIGLGLPHCT